MYLPWTSLRLCNIAICHVGRQSRDREKLDETIWPWVLFEPIRFRLINTNMYFMARMQWNDFWLDLMPRPSHLYMSYTGPVTFLKWYEFCMSGIYFMFYRYAPCMDLRSNIFKFITLAKTWNFLQFSSAFDKSSSFWCHPPVGGARK